MEGNPDFIYMGTVTANGFVELIPSDAELFGPVGNVRCHFRIDLFRIMWTPCVFLRESRAARALLVDRDARIFNVPPFVLHSVDDQGVDGDALLDTKGLKRTLPTQLCLERVS